MIVKLANGRKIDVLTDAIMNATVKVRLVATKADCDNGCYSTDQGPIDRAFARILNKNYKAVVEGWGVAKIYPKNPALDKVCDLIVPNYNMQVTLSAKKNFHRYVELPLKVLKPRFLKRFLTN